MHEDLHPSPESDAIDSSNDDTNAWLTWGKNILNEVKHALEEEGDFSEDINPLHMPDLGDKLLKHIKLLPVWSNVSRDDFGYGRVPASSSSCESEFNKIKNVLLRHEQPLLRCDVFVDMHLKYLQGKLNLVAGHLENSTSNDSQINQNDSFESDFTCDSFNANQNATGGTSQVIEAEKLVSGITVMDECEICANGNLPQGAHTCTVCNKNVHPFPPCSVSFNNEEGYGSRRVCNTCDKCASARNILASREIENWRGQGTAPSESRSLYLGRNKEKLKDSLMWKKHSKLPVLKNGNSTALHALDINGKKVCVGNTCAFDSLIQIIFTAAVDNDILSKKIEENSDNPFFKMVADMVKNGVGPQSYRMRAKILMDICQSPNVVQIDGTDKMVRYNCEMSVIPLLVKLLDKHLGITETATCNKGCIREKQIKTVSLDENSFNRGNAHDVLISNCLVSSKPRLCENSERLNCAGTMSSKINNTALIFAVEVYGLESTRVMTPLKKLLPEVRTLNGGEKRMQLMGVVGYRGPVHLRNRTKNTECIGHYTALCKRGTTWYEYDDSNGTTSRRKETYKIIPSLLLYANLSHESDL